MTSYEEIVLMQAKFYPAWENLSLSSASYEPDERVLLVDELEMGSRELVPTRAGYYSGPPNPLADHSGYSLPTRTIPREQHHSKGYVPSRFVSSIPPDNFGAVLDRKIYRSAFPAAENLHFLNTLRIRSVVTLVEGPYLTEYNQWINEHNLRHFRIPLSPNKGGVCINFADMATILSIVQDESNWPILIHCNKGKHRTGCVVGTYRLTYGMGKEEILNEYQTYAGKKGRAFDEQYLLYLHGVLKQDGGVVDHLVRDAHYMNILSSRPTGTLAQACRPDEEQDSSTPSILSPQRLLR